MEPTSQVYNYVFSPHFGPVNNYAAGHFYYVALTLLLFLEWTLRE